MKRLLQVWLSENRLSLGTKKVVKAVVPKRILARIKREYYWQLIRRTTVTMEPDTEGIKRLVKRGDFVVDAGAFVGFYAQFLAGLVGPEGEVWSFEPIPETFDILASNVKRLGLQMVRVHNCALSDSSGHAFMEIPTLTQGGESMYDARIVESQDFSRCTRVACCSFDSLMNAGGRPPTFMKIDVEGHELRCLLGALATIDRWKPALMIETLESVTEEGTVPHAVAALLQTHGYSAYRYEDQRFQRLQDGERPQNTFFLTPETLLRTAQG